MKLNALVGIRFLAALYVLIFHFWPMSQRGSFIGKLVDEGHVGVGLFFVLSGFVLAINYCIPEKARSKKRFLMARFARIVPVYLLAMVVSIPLLLHEHPNWATVSGAWECTWTFLTRLFLIQSWNPHWVMGFNTPAWSLSCEAFFYVVFCFLMAYWSQVQLRQASRYLVVFLVLALISPVIYLWVKGDANQYQHGFGLNLVRYFPAIRILEFAVGACLGKLYLLKKRGGFGRWNDAVLVLLVAVFIFVVTGPWKMPYVLLHTGGLTGLFALIIWALTDTKGVIAQLLSRPIMVLLGNASYALYILHLPLRYLYTSAMSSLNLEHLNNALSGLLYTVLAILLSVFVYKAFEEPMRSYINRVSRRASKKDEPNVAPATAVLSDAVDHS